VAVAVIGAGIAGVACARVLRAAGVDVVVHERAGAAGGRMASPRLHERRVDTGAAYFTVASAEFAAVAADWQRRGLAQPWTDTVAVHSPEGSHNSRGPWRWRCPSGLRQLVADLAGGLDVRLGSAVTGIGPGPVLDGVDYDVVVLAMPDPSALRLLAPELTNARAQLDGRRWEPVITVVIGTALRTWGELTAMFVNDHPVLALVADDGARRGDRAPVLVAHTSSVLAAGHVDDPDAVVPAVLAAAAAVLEVHLVVHWTHAHRWTHARPVERRDAPCYFDDAAGIGLCGDGWGTPKVETAWHSGTKLGSAIVAWLGQCSSGPNRGGPRLAQ